ncbi:MAG: glycosyltransferase [Clostridia bacterium]|nr:glycosyltransferase [Clostridia bacterium]
MKVAQINITCGRGSTGMICEGIAVLAAQRGIDSRVFYSNAQSEYPHAVKYMSDRDIKIQALRSHVLGNYGFNSVGATKRLIAELQAFRPDIVHLHNIHGHNVHLGMLLQYLKDSGIKTFLTAHDCWTMTGYCPHFSMIGCDRWKTGCHDCPQRREYSYVLDKSPQLYERKKAAFSGLDLTVIAPSEWTASIVRQSFLQEYPVKVIYNGIDLSVFRPTPSDFRQQHGIPDSKKIVLGVAYSWGVKKGLDVMIDLAKTLDSERYQVVMVGTNDAVDAKLPSGVIAIHRTADREELASIYTAADVFVNPTREEVLGLVNLESLACGTPVVTFQTGGSPECVDKTCGIVVDYDDAAAMRQAVESIDDYGFTVENCRRYAGRFDMKAKFNEYVDAYEAAFEGA